MKVRAMDYDAVLDAFFNDPIYPNKFYLTTLIQLLELAAKPSSFFADATPSSNSSISELLRQNCLKLLVSNSL